MLIEVNEDKTLTQLYVLESKNKKEKSHKTNFK